jgi:PLP dependent protein
MSTIQNNLASIHHQIEAACKKCGRETNEVKLLLATKTVEPNQIIEAVSLGETIIGENKVQEAVSKYPSIQQLSVEKHFIGNLQTNKVKQIIEITDVIQSVDRISLVKELDKQLTKLSKTMDILVQVNSSYEDTKSGVRPEETISFIKEVAQYQTLNIKGLMTIGANSEKEVLVRKSFSMIKELSLEISTLGLRNVSMDILSMGMSSDLSIAIEEGSTMVRVGSAIFGKRT